MNYSHGGEVKKLDKREDGVFEIDIQTSKLFKNLGMAKYSELLLLLRNFKGTPASEF